MKVDLDNLTALTMEMKAHLPEGCTVLLLVNCPPGVVTGQEGGGVAYGLAGCMGCAAEAAGLVAEGLEQVLQEEGAHPDHDVTTH